jgi:hypothetical protein
MLSRFRNDLAMYALEIKVMHFYSWVVFEISSFCAIVQACKALRTRLTGHFEEFGVGVVE